jgi:beta-ribofuranosylaminobenzene 5'-phosphate synthase
MRIEIKTPSRLHLGLIDLNGNLGRLYGSIGVAIDEPKVVLEAESSDKLMVSGKDLALVNSVLRKVSEFYGTENKIRIDVEETIPRHSGLGSGTQLCLAVASAYCKIKKIKASVEELAFILGRGSISGIGISAFRKGGFVVDSGLNVLYQMPPQPVIHRLFPRDWRFVIVVPNSKKGFSGKKEENAFRNTIPGKQSIAEEISRIVLMKLVPSLFEEDIEGFGYALTELDRGTGKYFASAQKGTYAQKETGKIIDIMLKLGACGAGQSSWGPACYALAHKDAAEELENNIREQMKQNKIKGPVFTTKPNNKGAEINFI